MKALPLFLSLLILNGIAISAGAQTSDSTLRANRFHSPKKAGIMSAVLPGLGQAYNKKYWKIPVIYAAFATTTYFIIDNNKNYQKYLEAYKSRLDDDPVNDLLPEYSADNLRELKNYYWRYRDFNIILTAGIYALNILDAVVDAHLYTFDISDDLSLQLDPAMQTFGISRQHLATSFTLRFNF